mmetsp:Transcript_1070/g.2330  ORF Transcript_1070/g.2330 Transcript_1070/m.2330 type:complete len:200 (+) Transcript_1070:120-719(+)
MQSVVRLPYSPSRHRHCAEPVCPSIHGHSDAARLFVSASTRNVKLTPPLLTMLSRSRSSDLTLEVPPFHPLDTEVPSGLTFQALQSCPSTHASLTSPVSRYAVWLKPKHFDSNHGSGRGRGGLGHSSNFCPPPTLKVPLGHFSHVGAGSASPLIKNTGLMLSFSPGAHETVQDPSPAVVGTERWCDGRVWHSYSPAPSW